MLITLTVLMFVGITKFLHSLWNHDMQPDFPHLSRIQMGRRAATTWHKIFMDGETLDIAPDRKVQTLPTVLILTPMKNGRYLLAHYFQLLRTIDYPPELVSIGLLVSDSNDGTREAIESYIVQHKMNETYRRIAVLERNFGYEVPYDRRHDFQVQAPRRAVMARARNFLLASTLADEDWVLWLDSDLTYYPVSTLRTLLKFDKDVMMGNCFQMTDRGTINGYDRNAWRDTERSRRVRARLGEQQIMLEGYHINTGREFLIDKYDPKGKADELWELDGVGATALLVRADVHREGAIFPVTPYQNAVETEGFGLLAKAMGYQVFGVPNLVVLH